MVIWRRLAVGFTFTGMVLTGLFLGCTRQIAVNPTTPGGVNTKTFTPVPPTNTFTAVPPTNTFTVTMTPTVTPTPNGPTNTFTPTFTATVTRTVTSTATPTLTVTATSTATPDPNMIDDFEDNDGNIIAQGGRNGFWYTANDASSTINPSTFLPTADTSDGSQYVGNVSGTVAASGFAELAASFSNPKVAYAIPGGATGVIFDVKATGPSSIWFSISDTYTDANGSDADGAYVPVTSAWTPVTVYFVNMDTRGYGGGVPTGTHPLDTANATSINWEVTTAGAYNLSIDNIRFTNAVPPPTPTPDCHPIDNMEDGDNQINVLCGRNGYWYCFSDQYSSATVPSNYALSASKPMTVATGETAASNPITIQPGSGNVLTSGTVNSGTVIVWGVSTTNMKNGADPWVTSANPTFEMSTPGNASSDAANVQGVLGPGCNGNGGGSAASSDVLGSYQDCPFAGFGFDFVNVTSGPKVAIDLSSYTGIKFDAKVDTGTTTNTILYEVATTETNADNDHYAVNLGSCSGCSSSPLMAPAISTSWQTYTVPWTAMTAQAYSDGGADGAFNPAHATSLHWQTTDGSSPYSIWIDNIILY